MCDVVVTARSGYTFSDSMAGDEAVTAPAETVKGSHGYDANEPGMHATFVAWGAGIRPGVKTGIVTNTCVAPTIATLLGLKMKDTDGQPLTMILAK
jgi:hypothetical protein